MRYSLTYMLSQNHLFKNDKEENKEERETQYLNSVASHQSTAKMDGCSGDSSVNPNSTSSLSLPGKGDLQRSRAAKFGEFKLFQSRGRKESGNAAASAAAATSPSSSSVRAAVSSSTSSVTSTLRRRSALNLPIMAA